VGLISQVSTCLPWQLEQWSKLVKQIHAEQLPHAILLTGVEHTGKSRFAMALARLLLCQQPEADYNCGHCHACELSMSGSHGDFRWMQPEGTSRIIKVDQIRELVDFGTKTASFGHRKVIVLSPAESMNRAAANSLLKLLEEPSDGTFIVLVCHRSQALPATIRSRCQAITFPTPKAELSLPWLDKLTAARVESEEALLLAGGQVMLAASMYENAVLDSAKQIRAGLEALTQGGHSLHAVGTLMADRSAEDVLQQLVDFLQGLVRNMGYDNLAGPRGQKVFGLLDYVINLQQAVRSGANPNRQLMLDSLSARFELVLT
jgi:DNA polymerase-3 subunit delta'